MAVYAKDTYVWLPDEEDVYLPAVVMGTFKAGEKGTVMNLVTEATYTLDAKESENLLVMDEQSQEPIADMVGMKQLDEPSLLHNLRLRYENDEIYTSIGSILVSVNPFKKLNIYSPEVVSRFIAQGSKGNEPHIYGVADNAFKNLIENKKSQSCIVSGESGAGKTEATKLFLQYLAEKSSAGDEKAKTGASELHEKILEANPLMEAFGNAKTSRNNNSSRFGKLIQVDFDNKRGKISGGNITQYLLEKSRIVYHDNSERNYHVFYQVCKAAALEPDFNEKLRLSDPTQYFYTNPHDTGEGINVEGINDMKEYDDTRNAMDVLDISEENQDSIFLAVAGILHLGNVEFEANGEGSKVAESSMSELALAAQQFGVDAGKLGEAMVKRKLLNVFKDHTVEEAVAARDAFAKALYGYMFAWLIERINESVKAGAEKLAPENVSSISVLDIFGFESFEMNSFEQLCINYCNEKLQGHFNTHIFALEQKLYEAEGIDLSKIAFADNAKTLKMIEGKGGLLSLLDEQNKLPKGSDEGYIQKVHSFADGQIIKKPDVKAMRKKENQMKFMVVHFAGEVAYTATSFLEKNRDRLLDDLQALGAGSSSAFVSMLFKSESGGKGKQTLGTKFKKQLAVLMENLTKTEPHYVRTIKPNSEKEPEIFTANLVLDQMRFAGLMEVCRIRKLGYPVRRDFKEFLQRYKPLITSKTCQDHVELTQALEGEGLLTGNEYQVGKTKVFMRTDQFNNLEAKREAVLGLVATKIQKVVRRFTARSKYLRFKKVIADIEAAVEKRDPDAIEKALNETGILPYTGSHLSVVQNAKKVIALIMEERRIISLLESAIAARDISALNEALKSAEAKSLTGHAKYTEAANLKKIVEAERACVLSLMAAVKANTMDELKKVIAAAKELGLESRGEYKNAVSALEHLEEEERTIKALDEAIAKTDGDSIVKYLTKMAELGNLDHPSVKKGQEITKEIAKASAEAERQMKELENKLKVAISQENVTELKALKPQVLKFGLHGELVNQANELIAMLDKKEQVFGELSAAKKALEGKSTSYDGITADDIKSFSELLVKAKDAGYKDGDEELSGMKDFETKMKSQVEATSFLEKTLALKKTDQNREREFKKAVNMIRDLGLSTHLATEVESQLALMERRKVEIQADMLKKQKEKLKETLVEARPEDIEAEKLALMEKKTTQHQELIAKASDTATYQFDKYYKIREKADFIENVPEESKKEFADKMLKFQNKVVVKSLLQFPAGSELAKLSPQIHKAILQYCGDLANPFPNTMGRYMIVTCLENPLLVDETYLLLMKQLSFNPRPVSEDRAWGLMCLLTTAVPPSEDFAPYVVNFYLNHKESRGLIGNYAKLCLAQLDGRIRLGPTKMIPSLELIDSYSLRPPILAIVNLVDEDKDPLEIPVVPDEDVERVLFEAIFPKLEIPEDDQVLYGLFVIDGKGKTTLSLKERLERYYKKWNPNKIPHIDYFVSAWEGNEAALFHKLEEKYGPEPSEDDDVLNLQAEGSQKKKKENKFLVLPISAAKQAVKRLKFIPGMGGATQTKPPPPPQTAWPVPWWVHPGDVYLRMVKQNRVPIFTFKRKLYANGEEPNDQLINQARYDVTHGELPVEKEEDIATLTAIHLTLRNKLKPPTSAGELDQLGLRDVIPVSWLAKKSPTDFVEPVLAAAAGLKKTGKGDLDKEYYAICKKQTGFGMFFFYINNKEEILVIGVDIVGVHVMDESRSTVFHTFVYRDIKEYGASPAHFWMKIVDKAAKEKTEKVTKVGDTVYFSTIQAWDLYGLVYDYTYNAKKLNL
eukprot:augustus_masked-scaffold_34-processed-gene-2.25-mRNA-1 protein AED:0.00 eAED:0.01 QI:0/-1/0/1/-1/1/1/0/1797